MRRTVFCGTNLGKAGFPAMPRGGLLESSWGPSEGDGALGEEPAVREAWKGLCRMMAAAWWEMEGRGPQG